MLLGRLRQSLKDLDAAAILAIAPRVIPSDPPRAAGRRHYDLAGAFSVTATMLLLVYTVTQAPQHGWTSARTALLAALTVLVGALFVGIELRVREPLVRLGILRSWTLVGANLGAMTMAGAYFSFQFVLSLYLQQTQGWSSLHTALAFLPAGLLVAAMAPRIGTLATRIGIGRTAVVGMAMFVPAYVNTSFQLGGAIVLAIVTAVLASNAAGARGATFSDYEPGLEVVAAVAAIGLVATLVAFVLRQQPAADVEALPLAEAIEAEAA